MAPLDRFEKTHEFPEYNLAFWSATDEVTQHPPPMTICGKDVTPHQNILSWKIDSKTVALISTENVPHLVKFFKRVANELNPQHQAFYFQNSRDFALKQAENTNLENQSPTLEINAQNLYPRSNHVKSYTSLNEIERLCDLYDSSSEFNAILCALTV